MGKRLQTTFSDINQRIIKRVKKDKIKSEERVSAIKRKSSTILDEPKDKQFKSKCVEPLTYSRKTDNVLVCKLQNSTDALLSLGEDVTNDLLFSDELKNSYLKFTTTDFYYHILDEISLEGLDGITIEAFWKRLSIALEGNLIINHNIKNFIWQYIITCNSHFQFYELPVPRSKLEIYNRFDYMNTDIGVVLELAYKLPDLYPVKLLSNPVVLGSCSTFNERIDITDKVTKSTITDAENRYGLKLVIVADQNLRTLALCGDLIDPLISFLNMEFCLLERVGRSRKLGELTQGHMSIGSAFNMDAKTIFHYKKQLSARGLVLHQNFYINSPIHDQNKTGSLLHLKRFYVNVKSYQSYIAGEIINFLKKQPGFRIESQVVRDMYSDMYANFAKIIKHADFRKCITVKLYPYKLLHPDASYSECLTKNKNERIVSCFQLINPYINVAAMCRNDDKDNSEDEDDNEDEELSGQMIYNMDSLRNCYYHIYLSGDKGCVSSDVRNLTGFDDNTVRLNLRKLSEKGVVKLTKFDNGRVRRYRYTTSCVVKPEESLSDALEIPKTTAKEKILERQRVALAKTSKRPCVENEPVILSNALFLTDTPSFSSCKFLITNFETLIEPEAINPSIQNLELKLIKKYSINLTFFGLNNQLFDINNIINDINANPREYSVNNNLGIHYIKTHSKKSMKTIALLLRAHLNEIHITEGLIETQFPSNETPIPDLSKSFEPVASQANKAKLDYMGASPIVELREHEDNITKEILSSTAPLQYRYDKKYERSDNTLTERVIGRIQIILDLINDMEVIEETWKLNKLIVNAEAEKGYDKKIDRKCMFRLMKRLVEEGYIKVFKISLYNNSINKTTVFICHPSVDRTDERIQNACQKIKWKCFTSCAGKSTKPHVPGVQKNLEKMIGKSPFSQADVLNSIKEMNTLNRTMVKELNKKINRNIGLTYGFKQKFTRIRIMHEFLFYLIYDYTGTQNPLPLGDVDRLFKSHHVELSREDLSELPKVYSEEISWKMFVPPLPKHTGWPTGWALLCDIIPRFPVSVFLKLCNCCFEDSELLGLLNHPVKRFFLVKDLPEAQRRVIFFKRKYSCWVYEILSHLVFCGLAQFGPHKYKEKEQSFFYLNRRASIKDTKSSAPGYNQVENKDYPTVPFYFNRSADLEQYWQTLHYICLNTKLNLRKPGNVVTLSYLNTKTEIVESTAPRTAEEALKLDCGAIPGDGKGAGGLDSSLWSHLIKNWFWRVRNRCASSTTNFNIGLKNEVFKEVRPKSMSFHDLSSNVCGKFFLPAKPASRKKATLAVEKKRPKRRPKSYNRVIVPKKVVKKAKREYNDELDKVILKKTESRRVRWTKQEEEPAMLCKIGDIIMNGPKKYLKQIVPFTTVRDVLHRISPLSKYKTSRAIQRYWRVRKRFYLGIENKVLNLFKLKPISETFTPLLEKIGRPIGTKQFFRLTDEQIAVGYVILMSYIVRNKKRIFDALEGNLFNYDHLSEENLPYTEREAVAINPKGKRYVDPKSEYDVKKEIVKSVIHSSLSSKETVDYSKHLFRIYKNYPDAFIREAANELRELNLLCFRSKLKVGKIWDVPFSISQYYAYFQFGTFNVTTAEEAYRAFADIAKNREEKIESSLTAVQKKRYGQLLGLNEFFTFHTGMKLVFYVPQSTIILNPDVEDHDELVQELAARYQLKLMSLQDNNEADVDFDVENESTRLKVSVTVAAEEDKEVSEYFAKPTTSSAVDVTTDTGNSDTINRLKTWVSDCIVAESERRSPSPEFTVHSANSPDPEGFKETAEDNLSTKAIGEQKTWGQIPTIEEIKEGMLNSNISEEDRTIPHITELSDLLSKNFTDLKMDAERLMRLKSHFITEFVTLEKIIIEDYDSLQTNDVVRHVQCPVRNRLLWNKIERDVIVEGFPTELNYEESIRSSGGSDEDVQLASQIIQFAASKESIGATAHELQDLFSQRESNCSLVRLVKMLIEAGVLYQMGVVNLAFVHYKFHQAWVVEGECATSSSTEEEMSKLAKSVRMKLRPWVRVDGVLDKTILKSWMSNIMSYILNYPNVSFGKICGRYFFIKPVDLFYIIQILEELSCAELYIYEKIEEDLFAEWTIPKKRSATFLDCLEDIIIQPSNVSLIRLGSFFSVDSSM